MCSGSQKVMASSKDMEIHEAVYGKIQVGY